MRRGAVLQMRLQQLSRSLETTTGLLEATANRQRLTLIPQMRLQFATWYGTRITTLRAGERCAGTLGRMQLQCVRGEFTLTVDTTTQTLGTILGLVQRHATTQHTLSALGLTVHRLLATAPIVLLQPGPREFALAELAASATHGACVLQVIGHHDPWYLGATLVGALGGIVFARVQMRLQLAQLIGPLAALFVVYAEDKGTHDGLLGIRTGIDLQRARRRGEIKYVFFIGIYLIM